VALKALDAVFSALFGETAAPRPMTALARQAAKVEAFLEAERQERASRLQESARGLGASDAMTPDELRREEEAQKQRSRDRGGVQSL